MRGGSYATIRHAPLSVWLLLPISRLCNEELIFTGLSRDAWLSLRRIRAICTDAARPLESMG